MAKARIVVIGSINMDLVLPVPRLPQPGETLSGENLLQIPGGKGANQAVAAARLGANVHMVGCVGSDSFGPVLRRGLAANKVNTRYVRTTSGESGVAVILLQRGGDNSIVLSGGANQQLSRADVDAALPVLRQADVVMLQLEIPLPVVEYAVALCQKLNVRVILDPAPAPARFPKNLFKVDIICPNETEAVSLLKQARQTEANTARALQKRGARHVVLKLGHRGSVYFGSEGEVHREKAFKVKVVDTTAAGDSMTAGLAVALGEGQSWSDALRFANAAGASACTVLGAQPSIPTRAQVLALLSGT